MINSVTSNNPTEVLIKCENVSKKFCRNFKQSLVYGLMDVLGSGFRKNTHHNRLRKNEFWAVKDISFELRRGECLGLIGHNGAGKSTLLKMLNGLIMPDQGKITMRGRIGALIELGAGFNPILTGRENIYNNGAVLGFTREEIDKKLNDIIEFSEIGEFIDSPVQNYSSGMKIRLGFAVAAQMEPDVLIIDEVLAVGDLGFQMKCLNRISELIPKTAIIYVSHTMPQVARICTNVILMDKGKSCYIGNDVPEGINKYVHAFKNTGYLNTGSGEVELKSLSIGGDSLNYFNENDQFVFENGNDLFFRITLTIKSEAIKPFFILLKIIDQQLREAINSFSHYNSELIDPDSKEIIIEVNLKNIYLSRGKHYISVGVESKEDKKIYCHATNALSFSVNDKLQGFASSTMPGEWIISKIPN